LTFYKKKVSIAICIDLELFDLFKIISKILETKKTLFFIFWCFIFSYFKDLMELK
jgi:hypothetical protein